jgi:hypothetical protein
MIRYMENLKTMYTLGSSTILSDGLKERVFCAQLTMKDMKEGEFYYGPGHNGPWNSGRVEYVEKCYRKFTREAVAYGRWTPPKLVCNKIKREMTTVKVIPRVPPARRGWEPAGRR